MCGLPMIGRTAGPVYVQAPFPLMIGELLKSVPGDRKMMAVLCEWLSAAVKVAVQHQSPI